ncbi:protein of unknown function [Methylocaldum szegediense]|uniref:Uncharacterized protein n=1 Tax=Methylocaldum szegediense TaxID=73780 RepID=A0ABM9I161_9GAMM|nr:protein of unknown function [Methylocaldum szegediense]
MLLLSTILNDARFEVRVKLSGHRFVLRESVGL